MNRISDGGPAISDADLAARHGGHWSAPNTLREIAKAERTTAMDMQREMNAHANDAIADFLRAYPGATMRDVINGLQDAITDAPTVYDRARTQQPDTSDDRMFANMYGDY